MFPILCLLCAFVFDILALQGINRLFLRSRSSDPSLPRSVSPSARLLVRQTLASVYLCNSLVRYVLLPREHVTFCLHVFAARALAMFGEVSGADARLQRFERN